MIERLTIQILSRNIVLEAKDNFLINIFLKTRMVNSICIMEAGAIVMWSNSMTI